MPGPFRQGRPVPQPSDELQPLLKRIFASKEFAPKRFGPARWIDGGRAYTTLESSAEAEGGRDIVRYDTATGEKRVLVSAAKLVPAGEKKPLSIDDYSWSKDGQKLLVFTNTKKVWRENTRGDYWVLDLPDGRLKKLGGDAPASSLMFAKFSPDGGRAGYVRANNIYVEDLATGSITQLTADGSATIVNGTSDWVYEEEFGLRDAFRFSPDGKWIAFWRFDTSGVGSFSLINDTDGIYPTVTTIPYPKAGTTNSAVKIGVVSAAGGAARFLELPGDPRNTYVPRMDWAGNSEELVLQQLNRLQNTNDVWIADARTGTVRKLLREQDAAWVDILDEFRWSSGGKELLWLCERDGWRRVYAVSRDGATRPVSPAKVDVVSIAARGRPGRMALRHRIARRRHAPLPLPGPLDGRGKPERVTPKDATGNHAYDDLSGRGVCLSHLLLVRPAAGDRARAAARARGRAHARRQCGAREGGRAVRAAPVEFFKVEVGGGVTLDGWMIKPPDFDPARKYPLLIYVYGEPAGTTVVDGWGGSRSLFHRALTRAGYIVASVDNRGTPAPKGRAWRKIVYGTVGVLSSEEQTAAVKALLAARPYLDAERVGVWGWSGGGSNTLNLMFRSPDVYQVGMAVAPVPDQRLYDTIYQERYMGLPQDNAEGYKVGSPINVRGGPQGTPADRPRHGRRQRPLPGNGEARQPLDRARQALRLHGLSQPQPLDLGGRGHVASHPLSSGPIPPGVPAARPPSEVVSGLLYDAVTFDCYGTLIDWEGGISRAFASAASRAGKTVSPSEVLAAYAAIEPEVEAGSYKSYRQVLGETAIGVASRLGWRLLRRKPASSRRACPPGCLFRTRTPR